MKVRFFMACFLHEYSDDHYRGDDPIVEQQVRFVLDPDGNVETQLHTLADTLAALPVSMWRQLYDREEEAA